MFGGLCCCALAGALAIMIETTDPIKPSQTFLPEIMIELPFWVWLKNFGRSGLSSKRPHLPTIYEA
jgi:hypothetical protein